VAIRGERLMEVGWRGGWREAVVVNEDWRMIRESVDMAKVKSENGCQRVETEDRWTVGSRRVAISRG
jgi:hypothetical protein